MSYEPVELICSHLQIEKSRRKCKLKQKNSLNCLFRSYMSICTISLTLKNSSLIFFLTPNIKK